MASNRYPFATKSEIKARILADDSYVVSCLCVLYDRQTTHEQETKTTIQRNHRGFMSSHAVNGCKLAEKVRSGETLDGEETAKARDIVCHYSKQLAAAARETALEANPDLAAEAAVFFTKQA